MTSSGAQRRDEPLEALGAQLGEDLQRHVDGHAVVRRARLEAVGELELGLALQPGVRAPADVLGGRRVDQQLAREGQQVRPDLALVAPPAIEVRAGDDGLGHAGGVEVVQRLVVDEDVAPARALLERLDLLHELLVGGQEAMARVPLALDQRAADELVTREDRIELAVRDRAAGHDRQAVERDALGGDHRRAPAVPAWLLVRAPDQVLGQRLDPARVDLRRRPAPQAAGLDQLGHHHPARLTLDPAARPEREAGPARAQIVAPGRVPQPEVREQSGQDRLVDALGLGVGVVDPDADLLGRLADLADQVLPLADAQVVQELAFGLLAELADRQLAAALVQVAPQVQVGEEVRVLVGVAGVGLVGLGLLIGRALAHVLDRQRRGDHDHLLGAAEPVGLEHHAAHARIDRERRELAPERRELAAGLVERAQLLQQRDAVAHLAAVGRIQEREVLDVAEVDRRHLQDHRGQRRAQDLRVGEARALRRSSPRSTAGSRCRRWCARSGPCAGRRTPG